MSSRISIVLASVATYLAIAVGCTHHVADASSGDGARIENETARLKRIIVLEPGREIRRIALLGSEDHPSLPVDAMQPSASDQHRAMVRLLTTRGVEVLRFEDLLSSALKVARKRGELEAWLRGAYPGAAETLVKDIDLLDAAALIGRGRFFYHRDEDGRFNPLMLPLKWMTFTRDVGVMTPRGFVLTSFANYDRATETKLARFVFRYAPELAAYPIAFDAEKEGVFVQGGDLMVLDKDTLLMGVGSLTESKAAEQLARKLNIDVLAVSMVPLNAREEGYSAWTAAHGEFLHLDTFFTLVDGKTAVAVPYLLESKYAERNPIVDVLVSLDVHLKAMQKADSTRHKVRFGAIADAAEAIKGIGWVTMYERGTGRATASKRKLMDVLKEQGFNIVPVGGLQGELSDEEYVLERVLFELHFQAGNVVALEPGVVIAYAENVYTNRALKSAGVKVVTFPGSFLSMWHGGPHCLTLPLERQLVSD